MIDIPPPGPVVPDEILVVGGSGFLGSELIRQFVENRRSVRNADIKPPKLQTAPFVPVDVRDEGGLAQAMHGAAIAYNLAAEWQDDVKPIERYYHVNVDGAVRFCNAAERCGLERIIFVSSVSVYGAGPQEMYEDSPPSPFNHYGRSKLEAEQLYRAWAARQPTRTLVIVRPTVICGPGNRGNVYNLIRQMTSGGFAMVGNGKNKKSMSYVENVAAFLRYCERFGAGVHVFNYADKPDFSMNDLVAFLDTALGRRTVRSRLPIGLVLSIAAVAEKSAMIAGRGTRLTVERVQKFCANTQVSSERVYATGFRPQITLEEGLRRILASDFTEKAD